MKFFTTVAVASLTLASGALASTAAVINNCPYSVFLTISRPNVSGQPQELKSKTTYSETIKGAGNSLGVSKNANFYSPSTPKLIFGYTDMAPTLFYSVNAQDGDLSFGSPSPDFQLIATDGCPGSDGYNGGKTLTCGDTNSVSVVLC